MIQHPLSLWLDDTVTFSNSVHCITSLSLKKPPSLSTSELLLTLFIVPSKQWNERTSFGQRLGEQWTFESLAFLLDDTGHCMAHGGRHITTCASIHCAPTIAAHPFLHLHLYNLHTECAKFAGQLSTAISLPAVASCASFSRDILLLPEISGKMDVTPTTLNGCQLDLNWDSFLFSLGTPATSPAVAAASSMTVCPIQMVPTTVTWTIYHVYLLSTAS